MTPVSDASPTSARLVRETRPRWSPPSRLTVSEFSDTELVVTSGPLAGTRMQTSFAPYQVGILNAFHETGVQIVVVMGSSQWGKTTTAQCVVAYHCKHDPCEILVVEPTVDPMAEDFSKNRLQPMINASPALREIFGKSRSRDGANTVLLKTFPGGFVAIGGANSAASLAARSVRLLVLDEVDRYPPELPNEGATLSVVMKRTTAYGRRRRILMLSSPTFVGGAIESWHAQGDQRKFYVPCPGCAVDHPYEWKNVRWIDDEPSTARLHCPHCNYAIDEAERVALLSRGQWVATAPDRWDRSIVSFHLWEAYSPLSSLESIVKTFLHARAEQKKGDKGPMHTWQNTCLGEGHEPNTGDGADASALILRREHYGSVNEAGERIDDADMQDGCCLLTMGVDTQDDRLEALVIGWGEGEESWIVDRHVLPGDTSQPEPWAMLDALLNAEYRHPSGVRLPIYETCIDSAGHRTTMVYAWAAKQAARRVHAAIGRDGQRPIVSSPSPRHWGNERRPVPLYTLGVDAAKSLIISRLSLTKEAGDGRSDQGYPGYVHLPIADWSDEELVAQLTAERLVKKFKKGIPVTEWVKIRARNEMLDCFVLALAAMRLANPRWPQLLEHVRHPDGSPAAPRPPARPAGWLGPRPKGWLRR